MVDLSIPTLLGKLVGGKEGYNTSTDTEKMRKLLLDTGFKSKNLKPK